MSELAEFANSAVLNLVGQGALFVVVSLIAWVAIRSQKVLDCMAKDIHMLSKNVAVVMEQIEEHDRRIERVEDKVFN